MESATNVRRDAGGRIAKGYGAALRERGLECGAKRRDGTGGSCRRLAAKGKRRCKLHGGARGSGARPGNINAWKHGCATRAARLRRKAGCAIVKALAAIGHFEGLFGCRVRSRPLRSDQQTLLATHDPGLLAEYDAAITRRTVTGCHKAFKRVARYKTATGDLNIR